MQADATHHPSRRASAVELADETSYGCDRREAPSLSHLVSPALCTARRAGKRFDVRERAVCATRATVATACDPPRRAAPPRSHPLLLQQLLSLARRLLRLLAQRRGLAVGRLGDAVGLLARLFEHPLRGLVRVGDHLVGRFGRVLHDLSSGLLSLLCALLRLRRDALRLVDGLLRPLERLLFLLDIGLECFDLVAKLAPLRKVEEERLVERGLGLVDLRLQAADRTLDAARGARRLPQRRLRLGHLGGGGLGERLALGTALTKHRIGLPLGGLLRRRRLGLRRVERRLRLGVALGHHLVRL
mmetsp:Transcript_26518/g.61886  ORF Transcript_26518/g.61886 Transcript_26518/m.61886 type:complete len:301 (-) Transcript_26518:166-1068(-)